MSPLLFVNWHKVGVRFSALMWIIASILAVVVLIHTGPGSAPQRHVAHPVARAPVASALGGRH